MGWLQSLVSIQLQVSFAKETYKRDDILQKRPMILSILLTVATPYMYRFKFSYSLSQLVSYNLILQSQSNWSIFNGTWQKGRGELDNWLRLEIEEMTLQMQ